jgi:hypothetical protein
MRNAPIMNEPAQRPDAYVDHLADSGVGEKCFVGLAGIAIEADKLGVFGCACHRSTKMIVANAYVDGEEVGDLDDLFPSIIH